MIGDNIVVSERSFLVSGEAVSEEAVSSRRLTIACCARLRKMNPHQKNKVDVSVSAGLPELSTHLTGLGRSSILRSKSFSAFMANYRARPAYYRTS